MTLHRALSTSSLLPLVLPLVLTLGCARTPAATAPSSRSITVLHANDTYRILGLPEAQRGGFARLRTLRTQLEGNGDVLVTHAGDLLSPSLLSQRTHGAHMIGALNLLDGDPEAFDERLFVTLGNHEFDRSRCEHAADLEARFDDSQFAWLDSNIRWGGRPDAGCDATIASRNLHRTALVDVGGVTVGLVSSTTDAKHPAYVDAFLDPYDTLLHAIPALRAEGAAVVIALTHLGVEADRDLLRRLPLDARPDLLLGGHDHAALSEQVEGTWLLKADADLMSAQVVSIRLDPDGTRSVRPQLVPLDATIAPDPALDAFAEAEVAAFGDAWCSARELPPTCLDEALGTVATPFIADEETLRTVETSAGDWLADLALAAGKPHGADVALLNSGGLRLNRNLPAGTPFTLRHMEEMFPFPSGLHLIAVRGAQLQQALDRSVEGWTGSGHFLQAAGLRFVHDPDDVAARDVQIQADDGTWGPLDPRARYLAVVPRYLVDPNIGDQDGYTMLLPSDVLGQVPLPSLRALTEEALKASGEGGIRPEKDGRICNLRLERCPVSETTSPVGE